MKRLYLIYGLSFAVIFAILKLFPQLVFSQDVIKLAPMLIINVPGTIIFFRTEEKIGGIQFFVGIDVCLIILAVILMPIPALKIVFLILPLSLLIQMFRMYPEKSERTAIIKIVTFLTIMTFLFVGLGLYY